MKLMKKVFMLLIILFISISVVSAGDINESSTHDDNAMTTHIGYNNDNTNMKESVKTLESKVSHPKKINKTIKEKTKAQPKRVIINSTTFNDYVTDGQLNDKINPGDVLDVQGLLDSKYFELTVNKPVNITSSTGDARWGATEISKYASGAVEGITFTINKQGAGTNVSNINFFQTKIRIKNTTDVTINNITNFCNNTAVGTINNVEELSLNIKITNSYFYCEDVDTWAPNFKVSGANGLLVENCTFIEVGYCMNTVYIQTQYNIAEEHKYNNNITLRNCTLDGLNAVSQAASCGLVMQGSNLTVENCTIRHNSTNTMFGSNYLVMGVWIDLNWGTGEEGERIADDLVDTMVFRGNILEGDYNEGGTVLLAGFRNAEIYNNTFRNVSTTVGFQNAHDNIFNDVNITNNRTIFENNTVLGTLHFNTKNNTIKNNQIANSNFTNEGNQVSDNEKIVYINDNNYLDYGNLNANTLQIDKNIPNNTKVYINLINNNIRNINITLNTTNNFTISGENIYHIDSNAENAVFINCNLPSTTLSSIRNYSIINSTLLGDYSNNVGNIINSHTSQNNTTKILTQKAYNNIEKETNYYFDNEGNILNTLNNHDTLIIRNTPQNTSSNNKIIIDKTVNITSLDKAQWNTDIIFIKGSENSKLTNLNITGTIHVKTDNITISNNTINNKVILENCENIIIQSNIINNTDEAIQLINTRNSKIINNTINAYNTTINIDINSYNNQIQDNILTSEDNQNINTIQIANNENNIKNNLPKIGTQIIIETITECINNTEVELNISVTSGNKKITEGQLLITLNGVLKENITITNETSKVKIRVDGDTGSKTIKAHYFPVDVYDYNVTIIPITSKKLKSYINTYNQVNAKIGEQSKIILTILDENGENVPDSQITYSISNYTGTADLINGTSTIQFNVLEEYKGQILTITYDGTPSILKSTNKTTFNPSKGDSHLLITNKTENNNTIITVNVLNNIGQKLNNGYIQFTGQNLSKLVKIENYEATLTIPTPIEETNITITFRNNQNYETSNITITIIREKKKTNLYLYSIDNSTASVSISGKLLSDGKAINGAKLTLTVNDKNYTLTPGGSGYFSYKVKADTGINKVTVTYNGGYDYYNASATTTFNSYTKNKTTLYLYAIDNSTRTVKITGKLLGDGNGIPSSKLTLTVNNKTYTVTPGVSGYFSYTIVPDNGKNNVQIVYNGNDDYYNASYTTTFNSYTKKKVTLYLYSIDNTTSNILISGKLLSDGKAISGAKITLNINGNEYILTPGTSGYFSKKIEAQQGINTVTATYTGNDEYAQATTNTTFNNYNGKKATLYFYTIENTTEDNTIKITGKLLHNGKAISGAKITLNINGKTYTVTPGTSGYFSYKYKAISGTNNITATFTMEGYTTKTVSTTAYAKKKTTLFAYALNEATTGKTTKISGKLQNNKQAVTNKQVTVKVGTTTYTATTNKDGYYSISYIPISAGVENVLITFNGDEEYATSTYNTTLTVIG